LLVIVFLYPKLPTYGLFNTAYIYKVITNINQQHFRDDFILTTHSSVTHSSPLSLQYFHTNCTNLLHSSSASTSLTARPAPHCFVTYEFSKSSFLLHNSLTKPAYSSLPLHSTLTFFKPTFNFISSNLDVCTSQFKLFTYPPHFTSLHQHAAPNLSQKSSNYNSFPWVHHLRRFFQTENAYPLISIR